MELLQIDLDDGIDRKLVHSDSLKMIYEFICPICDRLVFDPVICKENQCIYCHKCIKKWIDKFGTNAACKSCKKIFIRDNIPKLIKNVLNKIKLKCYNSNEGCKEIISYESFINHLNSCQFSLFKCVSRSDCEFIGIKSELIEHLKTCKNQLSKTFNENGKSIFQSASITCPVCSSNRIPLNEYFNHNNGACLNKLISTYNDSNHQFDQVKDQNHQSMIYLQLDKLQEKNVNYIKEKISLSENLEKIVKEKAILQDDYNRLLIENNKLKKEIIEKKDVNQVSCKHSLFLWYRLAIKTLCTFCGAVDHCRFSCGECYKFFCQRCKAIPKSDTCPLNHKLEVVIKGKSFRCDVCSNNYVQGTKAWNDVACDMDICLLCWPQNDDVLSDKEKAILLLTLLTLNK